MRLLLLQAARRAKVAKGGRLTEGTNEGQPLVGGVHRIEETGRLEHIYSPAGSQSAGRRRYGISALAAPRNPNVQLNPYHRRGFFLTLGSVIHIICWVLASKRSITIASQVGMLDHQLTRWGFSECTHTGVVPDGRPLSLSKPS